MAAGLGNIAPKPSLLLPKVLGFIRLCRFSGESCRVFDIPGIQSLLKYTLFGLSWSRQLASYSSHPLAHVYSIVLPSRDSHIPQNIHVIWAPPKGSICQHARASTCRFAHWLPYFFSLGSPKISSLKLPTHVVHESKIQTSSNSDKYFFRTSLLVYARGEL